MSTSLSRLSFRQKITLGLVLVTLAAILITAFTPEQKWLIIAIALLLTDLAYESFQRPETLEKALSDALSKYYVIGQPIISYRDYLEKVAALSRNTDSHHLGCIYLPAGTEGTKKLTALFDSTRSATTTLFTENTNIHSQVLIILDFDDANIETFAKILEYQKSVEKFAVSRVSWTVVDSPVGLNCVIHDQRHSAIFFAAHEIREHGILFMDQPRISDLLDKLVKERWMKKAISPVDAINNKRNMIITRSR
ncbi:MAG: hypothetical protein ABSC37_06285 [Xanthobacteraceae bacterium]